MSEVLLRPEDLDGKAEKEPEIAADAVLRSVENREKADPVCESRFMDNAKSFLTSENAKRIGGVAMAGALYVAFKLIEKVSMFAKGLILAEAKEKGDIKASILEGLKTAFPGEKKDDKKK